MHDTYRQVPPVELLDDKEGLIADLERLNGIHTSTQRILEASLLIDPHFLYPAILEGSTENIERAFGKEAWTNHLKARLFARQYEGSLNPDFILHIYSILSEKPAEEIVCDTQIEKSTLGIGADGNGSAFEPMQCSDEELEALHYNPYAEWLWLSPSNTPSHAIAPYMLSKTGWRVVEGFQGTGCINYIYKSKREKMGALGDICTLYNTRIQREGLGSDMPHLREGAQALAATLQYLIVSLHAGADFNGRASRILMNWSLKRHGLPPSMPNPSDILSSREKRIKHVQETSNLQARARQKIATGITDLVDIFELHHEQAMLAKLYGAHLPEIPSKLEPGKPHDPFVHQRYLRALGSQAVPLLVSS